MTITVNALLPPRVWAAEIDDPPPPNTPAHRVQALWPRTVRTSGHRRNRILQRQTIVPVQKVGHLAFAFAFAFAFALDFAFTFAFTFVVDFPRHAEQMTIPLRSSLPHTGHRVRIGFPPSSPSERAIIPSDPTQPTANRITRCRPQGQFSSEQFTQHSIRQVGIFFLQCVPILARGLWLMQIDSPFSVLQHFPETGIFPPNGNTPPEIMAILEDVSQAIVINSIVLLTNMMPFGRRNDRLDIGHGQTAETAGEPLAEIR